MKIKPLFDRVLIKPIKEQTKQTSALVLPESAKEQPLLAKILEVGSGGELDGKPIKFQVEVGEKILYSKYAGNEFKLDGEDLVIIRQMDILAILKN